MSHLNFSRRIFVF